MIQQSSPHWWDNALKPTTMFLRDQTKLDHLAQLEGQPNVTTHWGSFTSRLLLCLCHFCQPAMIFLPYQASCKFDSIRVNGVRLRGCCLQSGVSSDTLTIYDQIGTITAYSFASFINVLAATELCKRFVCRRFDSETNLHFTKEMSAWLQALQKMCDTCLGHGKPRVCAQPVCQLNHMLHTNTKFALPMATSSKTSRFMLLYVAFICFLQLSASQICVKHGCPNIFCKLDTCLCLICW